MFDSRNNYRPIPSHHSSSQIDRNGTSFKIIATSSLFLLLFFVYNFFRILDSWVQGPEQPPAPPLRLLAQSTIDQYNLYDRSHGSASFGMTPVTYQQIEEKPTEVIFMEPNKHVHGDTFSQTWYNPSNPAHNSITHKRLRELNVDLASAQHSFDWSDINGFRALTPIRDQGRTGTCWAFTSTVISETAWWLAGNELEQFSPQVLADCLDLRCDGDFCNEDKTGAMNPAHTKNVNICFEEDCQFMMFDNFPYCETAPFPNKGCGVRNGWGGGVPIDAFRYYWHKGFVKADDYPFRICAPHDWEYRTRGMDRKEICLNTARYCAWDESQTYPFSKCILGLPVSLPCSNHRAEKAVGKISGALIVSERMDDYYLADKHSNGEKTMHWQGGELPVNTISEERMKEALLNVGPLALSITSGPLHYYQGGILDLPNSLCQNEHAGDHIVTLVGYGEENGLKYWKIQNSWGDLWGEQGFVRIARGKNVCGVANSVQAAYV